MNKSFRDLTVIILAIATVWLVYELYLEKSKAALPEVEQSLIKPLDPNFNESVLDNLKKRVSY